MLKHNLTIILEDILENKLKIDSSHERSSDENLTIKLPLDLSDTKNNQFIFLSWPIILSISFTPSYNFCMLERWLESYKLQDFPLVIGMICPSLSIPPVLTESFCLTSHSLSAGCPLPAS